MVRDKDYEHWAVIVEAAKLAHQVGLEKILEEIRREYDEVARLMDPRFYGPDRDER